MRIYKVSLKDVKGAPRNEPEILVEADSRAGALRHAAEKTMVAEVASSQDLIRLTKLNVEVESAKAA
jgi:hypothetical protein